MLGKLYFESVALQAANYFMLVAELEQSYPVENADLFNETKSTLIESK